MFKKIKQTFLGHIIRALFKAKLLPLKDNYGSNLWILTNLLDFKLFVCLIFVFLNRIHLYYLLKSDLIFKQLPQLYSGVVDSSVAS